jgi:hypothetical protein
MESMRTVSRSSAAVTALKRQVLPPPDIPEAHIERRDDHENHYDE